MISILLLGLLIGLQHALEADHVAAVSSIVARETSVSRIVKMGAVWGLGHTLTLMIFAGAVIAFDLSIGTRLAGWLEFAVGLMLIMLGGHVIYRLIRNRVHFHLHRHGDQVTHFHAHSHVGEPGKHRQSPHDHAHLRGFPLRSLFVGVMHGMAGSATLVLLAATAIDEPLLGVLYVALFGLGSIAGMALLSAVIAIPLRYTSRVLTWANQGLQGAIGAITLILGIAVLTRSALALWPSI